MTMYALILTNHDCDIDVLAVSPNIDTLKTLAEAKAREMPEYIDEDSFVWDGPCTYMWEDLDGWITFEIHNAGEVI